LLRVPVHFHTDNPITWIGGSTTVAGSLTNMVTLVQVSVPKNVSQQPQDNVLVLFCPYSRS